MIKKLLLTAAALPAIVSCHQNTFIAPEEPSGEKVLSAVLSGYAIAGNDAVQEEKTEITWISGYHFLDGRLEHIYRDFTLSGDRIELEVPKMEGTLYLVAKGDDGPRIEEPEEGMEEAKWLNSTVSAQEGSAGIYFTGKTDLSSRAPGSADAVTMKRGVARFDLKVAVKGDAQIHKVVLHNVLRDAYLLPGDEVRSPENAGKGDVVFEPSSLVTADTDKIAYIYEQVSDALAVEVHATIDGKKHELSASLPGTVKRNTIYTITLRKDIVDSDVHLSVEEWGSGEDTDLVPDRDREVKVDPDRSTLPGNVSIADGGTALELPHLATDFILALDCDDQLELLPPEGHLLSVEPVETEASQGDFGKVNLFKVTKSLYAPNEKATETVLQFKRKGLEHAYPEDRITLRLKANPSTLEGKISFGNGIYRYEFGTYADNEFGVFHLPSGKKISAEFAEGEDKWVKIDPSEDGSGAYRILGGWKPNDPTADGREQAAVIVISNADGSDREEYTVTRRNYGLPVTYLHGIWWCKYNAQGNSRDFNDQVLSSSDPAVRAGTTLYEYLGSCSPEEYYALWGWAYQGDSGKGMKVIEQDGKAVMEGFRTGNSAHINKLPSTALSPDGYELPSMEDYNRIFDATDYIWMMWNGNHTLVNPWEGHSTIHREQKRKNGITVGSLTLSDLIYIRMSSPDFPENEPIVWYGPGAQWNSDGIQHAGHYNNMLFGVHSPSGTGWYIAGGMSNLYLHKNGAGNNDTRILRFKKSDVEYIY